ncbi:MAG: carboxyltransferase domain-containing protein, partial [Acidimicrobiales bacterium]
MNILPYGQHAILVELETLTEVHALRAAVVQAGIGVEVVPAWRSLLISTDGDPCALAEEVRGLPIPQAGECSGRTHELPVVYDGPDLDDVGRLTGLTIGEIRDLHAKSTYF